MLSLYWRWMALVARNTCMRCRARVARGRLRGQLDVLRVAAGEAADDRALHLARHRVDALAVPARGGREAGLDDVDAELGERARDAQLLRAGHAAAGRLLAVAQRGIEDQHAVGIGSHGVLLRAARGTRSGRARSFSHGMRARSAAPTFSIWRSMSASAACW